MLVISPQFYIRDFVFNIQKKKRIPQKMLIIKGKKVILPSSKRTNIAMENIHLLNPFSTFKKKHLDVVVFLEVNASMHMGLLEQPTKDESQEGSQGEAPTNTIKT